MVCGLGTTFLIPETARKTLEELSGDDYDQPASVTRAEIESPAEAEKEKESGERTNVSPVANT